MNKINRTVCILLWFACVCTRLCAQSAPYLCELGIQGGCGYYVGDAAPHIFMKPREAYGLHFRYKFTKRWAIQAKLSGQRLTGNDFTMDGKRKDTKWQTQVGNFDVMAEFNFFRFGEPTIYDRRIKPFTPYIFLGVGVGMYNGEMWPSDKPEKHDTKVAAYIPLGIGLKWKFHPRCGLNVAWQHNIYMSDNLELRDALDNKYQMNGWNWMNCDLTGMLTVGLVFEFGRAKFPCRLCNND